jgi:hypothetical protein
MSVIYFYSKTQNTRIQWIVNEILSKFGFEIFFLTEKKIFQNADGIKINYSENPISAEEVHIIPQGVLFEKNIAAQSDLEAQIRLHLFEKKPIDIFSAAFYLLARYEEYLPFEPDGHGRFTAKHSLAHRLDFLQRPLIDEWRLALQKQILQVYPNLNFPKIPFEIRPTYDIDQAFSYKNKGFFRTFFAFLKDIKNKKRWQVLFQNAQDPFDTFAQLDAFHQAKNLHPTYFILLGDWAAFDKNISHQNTDFQSIIKKIASQYAIGIHPSYRSNASSLLLKKEKNRLEKIIEKEVVFSRQHFLKLQFPTTYQRLIAEGITQDFSMGYADDIGFRASTSHSFFWYDLTKEEATPLVVTPFAAMDVTLKEYLNLTPSAAFDAIQSLKKNMQNTGGQLITLWHNSSFDKDWKGWKEMYFSVFQD